MRGLIIEGITGAGKTSIYRRLKQEASYDSCLFLSYRYSQRLFAPGGEPCRSQMTLDFSRRLGRFLAMIETAFEGSVLADPTRGDDVRFRFVLETLFWQHLTEYEALRLPSMSAIESRFAKLGATVLLLTVPHDRILEQCILSPRRTRNEQWRRYQSAFGRSDGELVEFYLRQQERMLCWAGSGAMPVIRVSLYDDGLDNIIAMAKGCLGASK